MDLNTETERQIIEWIDNIVGKPTKEMGFLVSGAIQRWRLMQALTTIAKARTKCIALNLPLNMISPKLICPLLENCSLESEEYMQDKWANMLVNMLDPTQNLQNHVFPFILSQISKKEFVELNTQYQKKAKRLPEIKQESKKYSRNLKKIKGDLINQADALSEIHLNATKLFSEVRKLEVISLENLEQFEIANAVRLGIVKSIQLNEARKLESQYDNGNNKIFVGHTGYEYEFTELGEMFFRACSERIN